MTDYGDMMMALHRKKEQEKKAEQMKNEVKLLKRRHEAGVKREERIKDDINSGSVGPISSYRLPLSVLPPTSQVSPGLGPQEVARARQIGLVKQQLEGHALTQGVTVWQGEVGEQNLTFDPIVGGRHYGPYELRLKFGKGGKMVLKGHSLPHEVPTQEVYREVVADTEEGVQGGPLVRPLALAIYSHLRAVISRQQQVQEMKDRFPDEVKEVSCSNSGTQVKLMLSLVDSDYDTHVNIHVSLAYQRHAERPQDLGLEFVDMGGVALSQEDKDGVHEACRAFYHHRLAAAVEMAFHP